MKTDTEIECEFTTHIICPYCGFRDLDSWEHGELDADEISCGSCGSEFIATSEVTIEYSTEKKDSK